MTASLAWRHQTVWLAAHDPAHRNVNPVSGWSTTAVMTWGLLLTLGEDLSGDPLSDGRRRRNHRQAKSAKGLSVANGSTLRYWTSS
jgi:hypothetical protein